MTQLKSYLGEFEELVLLAVLRLGDTAYGVTIRQLIEETAQRPTSIGAIYTTLDRLEQKGYLNSHQGEATAERGGRGKKYFRVNATGITALNEAMETRNRLKVGLSGDWEIAKNTI